MGRDTAQPKVETYASYGTYYTDYGKYPSTDATTKLNPTKRIDFASYTPYGTYSCYPGASPQEAADLKKRGYTCYNTYGTYPEAVDKQGSNMDKLMARRHAMNSNKDMVPENRDEDAMMQKRDMPPTTDTGGRKAPHETLPAGDGKYHAYK